MSDDIVKRGLDALLQKHAEELEVERAAHRDALALCEVYEARIAELEAQPSPADAPAWRAYEMMVDNLAVAQQQIADLKAQLAQAGEWEPVPDGEYGTVDTIEVSDDGKLLYIQSAYGNGHTTRAMIPLPDGWKLMRRVSQAQEEEK